MHIKASLPFSFTCSPHFIFNKKNNNSRKQTATPLKARKKRVKWQQQQATLSGTSKDSALRRTHSTNQRASGRGEVYSLRPFIEENKQNFFPQGKTKRQKHS